MGKTVGAQHIDDQPPSLRPQLIREWRAQLALPASPRYLAASLLVALLYFASGKIGLYFTSIHPNATLVWPPTGIALASLMLLGIRLWPAVFLGALLVNLTTASTGLASLGIAAGNTAEAVVAAYLIERFAGGLHVFKRSQSAIQFVFLGAMFSTTISATTGVTSLIAAGLAPAGRFGSIWLTWWLGDAVGALVVAPPIVLSLVRRNRQQWSGTRILEALALIAALVVVSLLVFHSVLSPLKFLCLPPILWAVFRFSSLEAALAVLLLSAFAVWGSIGGMGLAESAAGEPLLTVQAFMVVVAAMTLTLSAAVSERVRAEDALRQARDQLAGEVTETGQALAGAEHQVRVQETILSRAEGVAQAGSFQWDIPANRITWSNGMYRIYGVERDAFDGTFEGCLSRIHPDDRDRVRAVMERTISTGAPFRSRDRIVRPDGEVRVLDSAGESMIDGTGRVTAIYGVCRDITSEYHSERKLLESEERWRLLVDRVKDYAIFMLDPDGRIASWNQGAEQIQGYSADEIVGQHVSRFYTPEDLIRGYPGKLLETAEEQGHAEDEGWRRRKDDSRFWAYVSINALHDDQGRLRGFAKITRDLTERRQAELALQKLSGRILQVQDEEQRRIARDLHDSTSPLLTELVGKLYAAKRQLGGTGKDASKVLDDSLTLAEHASNVIRHTCSLLHPSMLDKGGLLMTLRWYLDGFATRTGIRVNAKFPEQLSPLPRETEIGLYRIVEECLANVLDHSGSKTADVVISESRDLLTVEVKDSGTGMRPGILLHFGGTSSVSGVGIQGMTERAKQLGGRLEIDSGGWGTSVKVILPRSPQARSERIPYSI